MVTQLEAPVPGAGSWVGPAWLWLGGTMLVGGHEGGGGGRPELVWSIAHGPWSWSIITYRPLYFTPIACCIELPIELPCIS